MWDSGWDQIFRDNDWGRYPPEELIRFVARSFGKRTDRNNVAILEVGCGPGANIWYLAREGYKTYGIDGSAVAITRAKEQLASEKLTAQLSVGDILTLPYPDHHFDCVIDIECVYANTFKDSLVILKEIHRVLKPGGLFFSKTFMTGTYGDGKGKRLAGEEHTYTELSEGALRPGYGVIRFTSREDIDKLYGVFEIQNVDYMIRSGKNGTHEVKEWLITCSKR